MAAQYAYVMKDMTKTFPGAQKPVLSNISLQFYQGAKIGIVGPNGAGKSTLIKIMAGIDKDFTGEAWPGEDGWWPPNEDSSTDVPPPLSFGQPTRRSPQDRIAEDAESVAELLSPMTPPAPLPLHHR